MKNYFQNRIKKSKNILGSYFSFSILSSSGVAEMSEIKFIVPFFFQILVAQIIPKMNPAAAIMIAQTSACPFRNEK